MHDSEQEHSGITGCRVTYESTIFYNEANKFSIIVVKTNDPRIPLQACSDRYYGDRMLRFTAVGYELPRTKAVELELDGEWVESKYGYQLQVEQWQEIVPQTADGLLAYLGSGLIKGIGPKTAEDIVATFGPDTLNILDNEPEKLLQIRGITEGKLKDIEESYAESRVLRNLMSLLGPFKITPATALKIYQHFGPACVDILKKCPYDLCQISGFGFKRVDGIVRKTDNRLHSTERIKGAVLYTLEDARSKSGHLFLPSEDLVKETLLLLNAPIPIPEQRVRTEEVQETLQQMILHGQMTIGSVARCVCCGGEQKNHRSIRCAECGNMYVCKGCGKTVHGYGRYIDEHFYCNECSYECAVCKEKFIGMPRIGIARSGEQRGICPACYEQVVGVCRNCTIHGDCLSIGANRFCPNQMSGLAA